MNNKIQAIYNAIGEVLKQSETKTIIENIELPKAKEYIMGEHFKISGHIVDNVLTVRVECNGKSGFTEFKKIFHI